MGWPPSLSLLLCPVPTWGRGSPSAAVLACSPSLLPLVPLLLCSRLSQPLLPALPPASPSNPAGSVVPGSGYLREFPGFFVFEGSLPLPPVPQA